MILVPVGHCYLLKQPYQRVDNFKDAKGIKVVANHLVFKNLATAFGQDVNYVYLFNPKTGKWKTFGQRYTYKFLKDFCDNTPVSQHSEILD